MKILILSFSQINRDPRVLRQITFVNSLPNSRVFLSGLSYSGDEEFIPLMHRGRNIFEKIELVFTNFFRINRLKEHKFLQLTNLNQLEELISSRSIYTILANDLESWPVAFALKAKHQNLKIILDAHEYYPRHFEDKYLWKLMHSSYYNYVCNKYIPQADKLITVAQGIGDEYEGKFGIKPSIVLNCPDFEPKLSPIPIEKGTIKLVHHGIANNSRKLEKMIHLMEMLDTRFHLYLMLMPTNEAYFAKLKKMAMGKKITFLDTVPTTQISKFINQFDMGIFLLEPINFNYTYALPNKFFEFIQARLAIVIGPSIEMKRIVQKENIGIVSQTFNEEELAKKLNDLSNEEIYKMKMNSHQIAEKYSNNRNIQIFKEITHKYSL